MKISLELTEEQGAIERELERARKAYQLNPSDKDAAPKMQHVDGLSDGIKKLPIAERNKIATALRNGTRYGPNWKLAFEPLSEGKYPQQFQEKLNAILADLET